MTNQNDSREIFGELADGREVEVVTLRNRRGVELRVISYGAVIVSLRTPDRNGDLDDIVLGFDDLGSYVEGTSYFGAVVGRYANRIAGARFTLDEGCYRLVANEGHNCLHGGKAGFDRAVWTVSRCEDAMVTLTHVSPAGDQGFPGELTVAVSYSLTEENELVVDYSATTVTPTIVNLTQHSYWNLRGHGSGDVLRHELELRGERFTPVDRELIPTGEILQVAGTPFDFRSPLAIGARINQADEQLKLGGGYDHNFVIDAGEETSGTRLAARVREPLSGRIMAVHTTEPGLQLYTGNRLDGTISGKSGVIYDRHAGFCLETQHFPDSPNKPQFPSTVLMPDAVYRSRTKFAFGTD